MPWLVRDYRVMGHFVLVRDNAGNELRIGNNPLAEGQYVLAYHPSQNALLLAKYKRMGEYDFCVDQGRLAKEWIARASRQVRRDHAAPRLLFLERHTPAGEKSVAGRTQEHAHAVAVRAGHLGTAAGLEAARARCLSVSPA